MLKLLLPRDGGFFNLFRDISDLLVVAANEFSSLLKAEGPAREIHTQRIKQLEHNADSITHKTMTELHKTFITPIDREDIHVLIKRLDDIMDFMDAAAQRVSLYDIGKAPVDPTLRLVIGLEVTPASSRKVIATTVRLLDRLPIRVKTVIADRLYSYSKVEDWRDVLAEAAGTEELQVWLQPYMKRRRLRRGRRSHLPDGVACHDAPH